MNLFYTNSLKVGSSVLQSPSDRAARYAKLFRPMADAKGLFVMGNKPGALAVKGLFGRRSPPTISGAIRAVIINAINRVGTSRLCAHIRNKQCKIIPPITNGDASAAVQMVLKIRRAIATRPHIHPCSIETMFFTPVSKAMLEITGRNNFALQTPATFRPPGFERPYINPFDSTARTPNLVIPIMSSFFTWAERGISTMFCIFHTNINACKNNMFPTTDI